MYIFRFAVNECCNYDCSRQNHADLVRGKDGRKAEPDLRGKPEGVGHTLFFPPH